MAEIGNTRFSPKPPHATVLYHDELYFVSDAETRVIMKSQNDVINFLKDCTQPEEFVIFNLDCGSTWSFDKK